MVSELGKVPMLRHYREEPFKVLIGTILSHRTRDENTERVTEALFKKYPTSKAIADAPLKELEKIVRPTGFYPTKAKRIKEVSKIIMEKFNSRVPKKMEDLLSLPGVGRKTANCVLVYGFNEPAIPVDTHVHRISNRLGWAKSKNPDKTEEALQKVFQRKHWLLINDVLVHFGRTICRPVSPQCQKCTLNKECPAGIVRMKTL